jgi:hypothetical protein
MYSHRHDAIRQAALTRRAHLSGRALLALLIGSIRVLERAAVRLRARLDPAGGADDPAHR